MADPRDDGLGPVAQGQGARGRNNSRPGANSSCAKVCRLSVKHPFPRGLFGEDGNLAVVRAGAGFSPTGAWAPAGLDPQCAGISARRSTRWFPRRLIEADWFREAGLDQQLRISNRARNRCQDDRRARVQQGGDPGQDVWIAAAWRGRNTRDARNLRGRQGREGRARQDSHRHRDWPRVGSLPSL